MLAFVLTSQSDRHQKANLAFASSGGLNFTAADEADLRDLGAHPFYSDGEEDSGVAFSALWLIIGGLHDSGLLLSSALPSISLDLSESVTLITLGLALWILPLLFACALLCRCTKTYSSTYNPPERRDGQTFEFGKMELR